MRKFKNVLLTVAIILIAAGTAFATKASKNAGNSIVPGYLFNYSSGECELKRNDCSTSGINYCTWTDDSKASYILSAMTNETTCVRALYEPY